MTDSPEFHRSPVEFPFSTTQPIRIMQTQPVLAVQQDFMREPVTQAAAVQAPAVSGEPVTATRASATQPSATQSSATQPSATQPASPPPTAPPLQPRTPSAEAQTVDSLPAPSASSLVIPASQPKPLQPQPSQSSRFEQTQFPEPSETSETSEPSQSSWLALGQPSQSERIEQSQPSQPITPEEASQAAAELQAFKTLETRSSRKKRNRVLRIALIVVGAILVVALAIFLLRGVLFPADTGVSNVATGTVEQGTYLEEITGNGTLAPFESVAVTPEVDGTIAELKVAEGDMVEAGQLLFTIDSPDLDAQISAAQRGVDSANLGVNGATSGRSEATRAADAAYSSYSTLKSTIDWSREAAHAAKEPFDEVTAQQQLDGAWQQYESAKSQISSAQQQVDAAYLQLADAQAVLDAAYKTGEKRSVYAPITGQVVTLNLERGMKLSTQASSGEVPLRIADLTKMKVTLNINELDIIKLKVDQVATLSFDAVADLTAEGKVSRISPVSAAGAAGSAAGDGMGGSGIVTFPVELVIENPDSRLKIGMSAQAGIAIKQLDGVLIVPTMALQGEGDTATLQVKAEDGSFTPVEVKVLARNDSTAAVEATGGGALKAGDEVMLEATTGTGTQGGAMRGGGSVSVGVG